MGTNMSTFLVDYENINGVMLSLGLDLLTNEDKLMIFYSKECTNIRQEYWNSIVESGCKFSLVKLLHKGYQYLDKYICTAVGEIHAAGEVEIAIISADKGYQAIIDYYTAIDDTDLRIVRSNTIEKAMLLFGDSNDKIRRKIIEERCQKLNFDEISARLKEREAIKNRIKAVLLDTPYFYMIDEICKFVENRKESDYRSLYTGAMHNFGRENGIKVYNILKKVI